MIDPTYVILPVGDSGIGKVIEQDPIEGVQLTAGAVVQVVIGKQASTTPPTTQLPTPPTDPPPPAATDVPPPATSDARTPI